MGSRSQRVKTRHFFFNETNDNFFLYFRPLTVQHQKDKSFVTVPIQSDFITNDVCEECILRGPHHGPDHVFKITLTAKTDETTEMRIFNDYNHYNVIQPNTAAFQSLIPRVLHHGNECYFFGRFDEDNRSALYINVKKLPTQ